MRQKLTRIIESASPETAVSPIKTKRERLLHVWVARNRKAARSRKRQAAARAEAEAQKVERAA
jgi:hypothetical protein